MDPASTEHAAMLHREAIVIDAHSDILMAVADGRVRLGERTIVEGITKRDVRGHYDLPRWLEGGVTAQVCALFIEKAFLHMPLNRALDMAACAYDEIAQNDCLMLATTSEEIRQAKREGKVALILSFEGADPLVGNLKYLRLFYQLGVRMISLTHARRNYFAGGVIRDMAEDGGLTSLGVEAIKMMNELGIVVDLRHLDARAFNQILEITEQPVVVSHVSSRRAFSPDPDAGPYFPFTSVTGLDRRRLLHAVGENGGVVCIIFALQKNVDAVMDDIEYVAAEIGVEHVGLGTDFYGLEIAPVGAEDISKLPLITELLVQRDFSDEQIKGILGGNLLRLFDEVWK